MGADIHMFLEKKSLNVIREKLLSNILDEKKDILDEWNSVDIWVENPDYPQYSQNKLIISRNDRIYSGRNYYLFGVLAKVRWNCPKPISNPKGFPKDASDEVRSDYESWGSDAHTASYLTLKELKDYDWSFWDEYDLGYGEKVGRELVQFKKSIEKMESICKNPEDIRIVFWFDN